MNNKQVSNSMFWKMLERGGYLGCQFVIQIVMARILNPDDYGMLSIMTVFTTLANVFVQSGLTSAIIQAKQIDEKDVSSVLWFNLAVSLFLACLLYVIAPLIERYYGFIGFVKPFRVLLLILPISANSAVRVSLLSKKLDFRPIALGSLIGVISGGAVGIVLAVKGFGIWALVFQQIVFYFVNSIALSVYSKWWPSFFLSVKKIRGLLDFGWKVLASNIVESIYNDFVSLAIGKKYTPTMLAYYNRGKQYPNLAGSVIKETLQTVLFPTYSRYQDNLALLKEEMRRFVRIGVFLMVYIMSTMAAAASPLVRFMLTDKWLPCVPYLRISCIFFAIVPINIVPLQGVNAIGRSDIYFKLSVSKRIICLLMVVASVILFNSVMSVALVWAATGIVNIVLNYSSIRDLFAYRMGEMIKDTAPSFLLGVITFAFETLVLSINLHCFFQILLQLVVGAVVYFGLAALLKMKSLHDAAEFVIISLKK